METQTEMFAAEEEGVTRPGSGAIRRVFLGWDGPALEAAADWLRAERGDELGELLVALPGGRAVRRLGELLARRAAPGWRPPRLVTQGRLVDELVELERPTAGRLARTLAWRRALERLSAKELEVLARGAARRLDAESRTRLAETVRGLHGALAPEGLDFDDLARTDRRLGSAEDESERVRWRVLAKVQATWRELLAAAELADPHEGRRAAIEAGRVDGSREVVLVGVADMTELLAAALGRLGPRATALVVAPEGHADGFDALGRLVPAYWSERDVALTPERWFVEEKPSDQADRALALLADWSGRHAAEAITIGLADDEVAPYLERRLRGAGARLRIAAGTALARTRPFKLLEAVARFAEQRAFADLAALVRHPDVAPRVATGFDPADALDRYHEEHLPRRVGDAWPGEERATRRVSAVGRSLDGLLGDLAGGERRDLAAWAAPIRALLERVYAKDDTATLDPEVEDERVLAGALRRAAAALDELGEVPPALVGGPVPAHEALRLLLRALRPETVPPAPARADEPTVEALGWLELPLDDAPALVVTGFNEGRVPQSTQGDAFLPDGLRARLGLPDDATRLARDVYATHVLLASRADCAFVTGRRARSGDPLVPSRIAFRAPPDEIVRRVRRFLPPEASLEPAPDLADPEPAPLARLAAPRPVTSMSVTSFKDFLGSPYLFYLRHVLRLRTRDDRARELDPLRFGSFAHRVLQDFGEGAASDSADAGEIEAFLVAAARERAARTFGESPLPAIAIQLEQLQHRFRAFGREQAARRRAGWRIARVEWEPAGGYPLVVDGEPMLVVGKLDRIDLHDDGRWAVLDYKTGEKVGEPEKAARDKGGWKDLQLPLYRELAWSLAAELGAKGEPQLGYFALGKDEDHVGTRLVTKWSEEDLRSALACAADVVRRVRRGELFEAGRPRKLYDPILEALLGQGLLSSLDDEDDEGGEA